MGVTQLWQILSPVECHQPLSSLQGLTLAVDLSIWVCETQAVKQMQGIVSKPFLRNLFFRISHLTQNGVKLVFVIEGTAPELKWDTMMKRQQSRFPGRQAKQPAPRPQVGKQTRKNFNACLKECCELLDILGIPYIQSRGEAEALCALLNVAGLVDGCLTNDGDAFLYGARVVYRNFTMNTKDPHVETYRMSDIEDQLGLDRTSLIALGLLIGCDFVPKGVPGIGMANAVKLLQTLKGRDVISRFKAWRSMSESDCIDQVEVLARRKALGVPDFPQVKVIQEFQMMKDRCPTSLSPWKRPVPAKLQDFAYIKLEWPPEYTLEKVLPLVTLWDMLDLLHSRNPSSHQHLKPHRIVKSRVRQGVSCYEVQWIKPVTESAHTEEYYVTVEAQELFSKCHPNMVSIFQEDLAQKNVQKATKGKKKKGGSKKDINKTIPSVDDLSFNFEKMNMDEVNHNLVESAKDLRPSYNEPSSGWQLVTKAKHSKHLSKHIPAISNTEREESATNKSPVDINGASHRISVNGVSSNQKRTDTIPRRQTANESENLILPADMSCGDGLQNQGTKAVDGDTYTPLSERAKRRLRKKQRDKEKALLESQKTANPGADVDIDSITESELEALAKKTIDKLFEEKANSNLFAQKAAYIDHSGDTNICRDNLNQFRMSSSNGSSLHNAGHLSGRGRGTSSPAVNSSCTPMTFMKQPGSGAVNGTSTPDVNSSSTPVSFIRPLCSGAVNGTSTPTVNSFRTPGTFMRPTCSSAVNGDSKAVNGNMFFSPIPNGNQCETDPLANFRFIDTPDISEKVYGSRKAFDKNMYALNGSENSKPFLNGKGDEMCYRTDSVHDTLMGNAMGKLTEERNPLPKSGTDVLTPRFQPHAMRLATPAANSMKTAPSLHLGVKTEHRHEAATKSPGNLDSDVGFGNFSLQSSLMNSLCASLVQAMTPKGISTEEYESLRATLQKMEQTDAPLEEQHFGCTEEDCEILDLSEIEKASSTIQNPFGNGVELKPISLCNQQKAQEDSGTVQMTKTAKKKLRKAQKLMRENLANENEGKSSTLMKESRQLFGGKKENGMSQKPLQGLDYGKNRTKNGQNNTNCENSNVSNSNEGRLHSYNGRMKALDTINTSNNVKVNNGREMAPDTNQKENNKHNSGSTNSKVCSQQSSSESNGKVKSKKKRKKKSDKNDSCFYDTFEELMKDASHAKEVTNVVPNTDENSSKLSYVAEADAEGSNKKKKKSKKKKIKKASADMDFSADGSMLNEKDSEISDEFLVKALTVGPVKSSATTEKCLEQGRESLLLTDNGMTDDTLLELETLSFHLAGTAVSLTGKERLKLAALKATKSNVVVDQTEKAIVMGNSKTCDDQSERYGTSKVREIEETVDGTKSCVSENDSHISEHGSGNVTMMKDNGVENGHHVAEDEFIDKEKVEDTIDSSNHCGISAEVEQCLSDELTDAQLMTCRNCGRNEWFESNTVEDSVGTPSIASGIKECATVTDGVVKSEEGDTSIDLFDETDFANQTEGTRSQRIDTNAFVNGQTNGIDKLRNGFYAPNTSCLVGDTEGKSLHVNGFGAVCTQQKAESSIQSNGHGNITESSIGRNKVIKAVDKISGLPVNGAHAEAQSMGTTDAINDSLVSGNGAFGGIVEASLDFLPTPNPVYGWESPSYQGTSESSGMQNGDRNHNIQAQDTNIEDTPVPHHVEDTPVSHNDAAATPKSLIERLKLKLKKASSRKALKSFTNKDKKAE